MEFIFAEQDTILVFMIFYKLFGGGTRLAMPNNLRVGLIVIEAWFGGYWGSLGLGGVRVARLYLQPDSWTMKIQD